MSICAHPCPSGPTRAPERPSFSRLGLPTPSPAGSPQRPLEEVFPGYWVLDEESYPFVDE